VTVLVDSLRIRMNDPEHPCAGHLPKLDLKAVERRAVTHLRNVQYRIGQHRYICRVSL
jgi:hypothetical protein